MVAVLFAVTLGFAFLLILLGLAILAARADAEWRAARAEAAANRALFRAEAERKADLEPIAEGYRDIGARIDRMRERLRGPPD